MAQALIFRSSATLSNPGDGPILPPPPDITTGLLWRHQADTLALANGAAVPTWASSEGSRVATLNGSATDTTRHPRYKTNAVGGHASVTFDAVALQGLGTSDLPGNDVGMPYTAYVVGKFTNDGTFVSGWGVPYLSIRGQSFGRVAGGAGNSTTELISAGNVDAPGPFADGAFHIAVVVYNGATSAIYVDNREPITGNLGVPNTNARLVGMRMGTGPGGNTHYLAGEMAEHGGFGRALSAIDVTALIASLRTKYSLT